jgi:uncharacterized protein (TIGR02099 family)
MAAGALVFATIAAGVASLVLPWLDSDPRWAARWLGETLDRDVELAALEFTFAGGAPVLRLRDVRIRGAAGRSEETLALRQVEVELSALASLRAARMQPRRISIVGADLGVTLGADGLALDGFGQQDRPPADALGAVVAALPEDSEFTLEQAHVTLRTLDGSGHETQLTLRPARLRLARDGDDLLLSGEVRLDDDGRVRAQTRWRAGADPLREAELSVSAEAVSLRRLGGLLGERLPLAVEGHAQLDLSAHLSEGRLAAARGSLTLRELAAQSDQDTIPLSLSALFDLTPAPGDWQLNILKIALTGQDGRSARPGSGRLRAVEGQIGSYQLELDALSWTGVNILGAALDPATQQRLDAVVHGGRAHDLVLRLPRSGAASLRLRFEQLVLREAATEVTLTPASGHLQVTGNAGRLTLSPLALTLPPRHDGSSKTLRVSGALDFARGGGGISVRPDGLLVHGESARASVSGTARWTHVSGRLRADLLAKIPRVSTSEILAVLGSGFVAPPLDRWLRGALDGGEARDVALRLFGSAGSPSELVDILAVEGTVHGVRLDYAAGWPVLEDLTGRLSLQWPRLGFTLDGGTVSGNRIEGAEGRIDDVDATRPRLEVSGQVSGSTQGGAAFLLATPLRSRFEDLLANLEAQGRARLGLNLDIPVAGGATAVSGRILLRDNTIALPSLRSGLQQVNGEIRFTGAGLRSGELQARYLDRPITATLEGNDARDPSIDLAIRGRTTPSGLMRHLHAIGAVDSTRATDLPLLGRLRGEAAWTVQLRIPGYANPDRSLPLTVRSDLRGMALALPAPLGKAAAPARELRITTRLSGNPRRQFQVSYGDAGRARLEVRTAGQGYILERAGIHFGGGDAELPAETGITVSGRLTRVSVDTWLGLIAQLGESLDAPGSALGTLRRIAVRTDVLEALGARFSDVALRAGRNAGNGLEVSLEAPALAGRISIPLPFGSRAVTASFNRLHASVADGEGEERAGSMDARRFPALDAEVADLRYGDLRLGRAWLSLRRGDGGTRIQRLELIHSAYGIAGSGTWRGTGKGQRTTLSLRLQGEDLGQTLRALGYSDSGVQGAPVDIRVDGQWQGSPLAFSLERVRGDLELEAGRGRFTGASPGATGRVFGLLSLTMLPRRLFQLDFSDLFGKGIGFRRIRGRFSLEDGNAYTNTLSLDADTAQLNITGRVGLADRDYDQTLTVVPKLSSSLPLVPLWLAEQVLDRKLLDPAFAYRYSVTGSWDDPSVERIRGSVAADGDNTTGSER